MKRAIIESPFRGANSDERLENIKYARACCKDAVSRGYVPFASHLLFPQFLNEDVVEDRNLGIEMGYDFWEKSDIVLFYCDRGISPGMERALIRAFAQGIPYQKLTLSAPVVQPSIANTDLEPIADKPRVPVDFDKLARDIKSGAAPTPKV